MPNIEDLYNSYINESQINLKAEDILESLKLQEIKNRAPYIVPCATDLHLSESELRWLRSILTTLDQQHQGREAFEITQKINEKLSIYPELKSAERVIDRILYQHYDFNEFNNSPKVVHFINSYGFSNETLHYITKTLMQYNLYLEVMDVNPAIYTPYEPFINSESLSDLSAYIPNAASLKCDFIVGGLKEDFPELFKEEKKKLGFFNKE